MTGADMFVVQLVIDGQPMNLTGVDLEAAVVALVIERGMGYTDAATRCRSDEATVKRIAAAYRKRAKKRRTDAARGGRRVTVRAA